RCSRDEEFRPLLSFYKSYRAFVRGKVVSLRLGQDDITEDERGRLRLLARSYFDLASGLCEVLTVRVGPNHPGGASRSSRREGECARTKSRRKGGQGP